RTALSLLPGDARAARAFAVLALGLALRMTGNAEEAVHELTRFAEPRLPVDAPMLSWALVGLATHHAIDADLPAAEQTARRLLGFGVERNHAWSTQWGHLLLGLASYQRDAVDDAIEHLAFVVGNRPHAGFAIRRDSMIGLGLAYQANGQQLDAQMLA